MDGIENSDGPLAPGASSGGGAGAMMPSSVNEQRPKLRVIAIGTAPTIRLFVKAQYAEKASPN
jgi:hypothetical protein